jgi:hypothetical protein
MIIKLMDIMMKKNWVTEFYVVAAKHSNEHETMKGERDARYENKKYKECKEKSK